jgi:glycosyltransferase involved in cell wall biosynthesis
VRIGFDVSQTAEQMAGCGVVADQLLRHLGPAGPGDVFIPYPVFGNYRNPNFVHATRPAGENVVDDHFRRSFAELNAEWNRPMAGLHGFLGHPEIVQANNFFCPVGLPVPVVYTVYDMSHAECPQFHSERNRQACFNGMFDASLHANHFVAISRYSRDRFLAWFPHVPARRVSLIYPAARPSLISTAPDEEVNRLLHRFDIAPDGFWLAVGTIEPRKNYRLLLDAYARLLDDVPSRALPLCVAGQSGWIESLDRQIERLGLRDHVRLLGFVEDADLAILYRTCFAFVYPSAYEGFGLPVVEALANGAAVVTSRSTSLPEVVGDAALLARPAAPAEYLDAMKRLLLEPGLRGDLRDAAREQARKFSWDRSAAMLLDLYHSLVNAPMAGRLQSV